MNHSGPYANGLYPIIRRARRPLVVVDTPPAVVGKVEPVKPVATTAPELASSESGDKASQAEPVVAVPVVADVPPVVVANAEPVQPVAATPVAEPDAVTEPPKSSKANASRKRKGR